ncbi:hypothetical protein CCHL11_04869 [Colletotrichum chlorophyti]|uniref:Uncharacterized protein n=1 Tax=Colletotrichum chlorophyti TaxID=708187 RepID=A0A1Q8S2A6_9PEZI|nr:hypothetical protein CCHL11_04869 [Colletotrichum chlorophyti]
MSGMHSTFSSSFTGDKRHSYAVLSALQQSNSISAGNRNNGAEYSQTHAQKDADAASVSSFGSSVSLLKNKLYRSQHSAPNKSASLVARQRAAEHTGDMSPSAYLGPVRNDL